MEEESTEQLLCILTNPPPPPFDVTLAVQPPPPHHAFTVESLKMVWFPAGSRVTRIAVQMILNQLKVLMVVDCGRWISRETNARNEQEEINGCETLFKTERNMITLRGDAELELVDSLDPFSEGVVFSVRPPKKSWKNIANLSGGEKTLSSLALVFALHHYKPTPLYVMDEIDAALDFKNVSIVGHYVKDRTKDAQFIIISLRNNMFELADRLVGIYKTDNCTESITINPGSFAVSQKTSA
ncbi:P-loop containing nucleoside triphosphate hydrolase protein [Raphanus sativus]|nr:P-loop containing nucleoside triphosphate hydrolase protein [Raphanus sativus]